MCEGLVGGALSMLLSEGGEEAVVLTWMDCTRSPCLLDQGFPAAPEKNMLKSCYVTVCRARCTMHTHRDSGLLWLLIWELEVLFSVGAKRTEIWHTYTTAARKGNNNT